MLAFQLDPYAGASLAHCVEQAIKISQIFDCSVTFIFNEQEIKVFKYSIKRYVMADYQVKMGGQTHGQD